MKKDIVYLLNMLKHMDWRAIKMKKRFIVLLFAMLLIFTGCQEEEKKEFNLNNAKSIIEENISELRDISEDTFSII